MPASQHELAAALSLDAAQGGTNVEALLRAIESFVADRIIPPRIRSRRPAMSTRTSASTSSTRSGGKRGRSVSTRRRSRASGVAWASP